MTFAPMQYLSIYTHGFHGGGLGTRSYAAYRSTLTKLDQFAKQLTALWQDEIFRHIRVHAAIPQPVRIESSGEVEMHYILDFGERAGNLILLRRDHREAASDYAVVSADEWATPHHLLGLAGWETLLQNGLPDIFWGSSELAIDDMLQMRTGMIVVFVGAEMPPEADGDEALSLLQTSWFATDRHHGRSVGVNGARNLPPPGNGRHKTSFSNVIWVVQNESTTAFEVNSGNYFLDCMIEELGQDQEEIINDFQADFRFWANKSPWASTTTLDDHWPSYGYTFLKDLQAAAFHNPFAANVLEEVEPIPGLNQPKFEANDLVKTSSMEKMNVDQPHDRADLSLHDLITEANRPPTTRDGDVKEGIDFSKVGDLLIWLDAHVTIPNFLEPAEVEWHDCSIPWLGLHWWQGDPFCEIHFYTDGSNRKEGPFCEVAGWHLALWWLQGYEDAISRLL